MRSVLQNGVSSGRQPCCGALPDCCGAARRSRRRCALRAQAGPNAPAVATPPAGPGQLNRPGAGVGKPTTPPSPTLNRPGAAAPPLQQRPGAAAPALNGPPKLTTPARPASQPPALQLQRPGAGPVATPAAAVPSPAAMRPGLAAPPPALNGRPGPQTPPPPGKATTPSSAQTLRPQPPSLAPSPTSSPPATALRPIATTSPAPTQATAPTLNRPLTAARPVPPPSSTPGAMPTLNRPMPPSSTGVKTMTASFADSAVGSDGLKRPDPPPLRVLEPLIRPVVPQHDGATRAKPKAGAAVVNEDEDEETKVEEGEGDAKKEKRKGRRGKLTAEMKRAARKLKKEKADEKAAAARKDREEIFEVGDEGMSLEQLADVIQVDASEIVRSLFMKGIMLSMNQVLDKNTCKVVAAEYDLLVVDKEEAVVSDQAKKRTDYVTDEDIDDLVLRPPVVTVMGHVDHGKTSLLDSIRKARVAAGEAGGITQSIGAYNTTVEVDGEQKTICFLDTPGHEAFSAMRARGAQVTDVAIIIVAADDGVRPQTKEAVAHAQAAGVPILVAINKIDMPGADVERTKQQLLELNLVPEEWGGSTPMVAVSAKKGTGIEDLLGMVSWIAEEKQLMANPKRPGQGTVIESHLDKRIGPVATLLVQAGTLRVGDLVVAGGSYGKVRVLRDDLGRSIQEAGPSIAVQLIGMDSVPMAGEEWCVAKNEQAAREQAEVMLRRDKAQRLLEMTGGGSMVTLSSLATVDEDMEALQKLNLIIKGDTMGVVEAIKSALGTLPQQSITLRYLLSGAGDISISDVDLAAASGGLVLGFNLQPDSAVEEHAKRLGVKIMTYKVIYNLIDDVKAAMEGKLRSVEEKIPLGKAEVKAVFGSGKKKIAGCLITTGKLQKGATVSVKRGKTVVYEGKLTQLRRLKDTVEEVNEGTECGMFCEGYLDWQAGDQVECYNVVTKNRRLEEAKAFQAVDMSTIGN